MLLKTNYMRIRYVSILILKTFNSTIPIILLRPYIMYNIILTGNISFDISYFKKPVHRMDPRVFSVIEPNKSRRVF